MISRTQADVPLQSIKGHAHLMVDCWTSPNTYTFMGIGAHYQKNGKAVSIILDFVELGKVHMKISGNAQLT